MKKWILKAIVQKIISYLPWGDKINYFFQKYVTKGVYLTDEYFYDRLGHARDHLKAYATWGNPAAIPASCLELGTGWYPIVPVSFFLVNVEKIYSVDITFLTSEERIKTTIEKFIEAYQSGKLKEYLPQLDATQMDTLLKLYRELDTLDLETILQKLRLTYLIEDARKLPLPENAIDLINSNNTFEHIYPEILIPILREFKRVVNKDTGIQSHFIDMSDHFAHFDHSINIYNFLQFSDRAWRWIDNSIQPQSRLRIDDYKKIYADLGLPITEESQRPGRLEELDTIALHPKYASKPREMAAVSHCHFVSRMRG